MKSNRAFERRMGRGFQVPIGGTEENAVLDVEAQMRKAGLQPNREGAIELVRHARAEADARKGRRDGS